MLSGLLFTPTHSKASFIYFVFGAEKVSAVSIDPSGENSQTIELLQPNFSLPVKNDAKDKKSKPEETIQADASISIVSENALMPSTTPLSNEPGIGGGDFSSTETSFYVVRKGDSLAQIAQMFDITVDTILSANEMKPGDKPKEGDVLLILPFSGVEHTVQKGETLQGIANKYKVDLEDILLANDLDDKSKLALGAKLMIPGGDMLAPAKPKVKSSGTIAKSGSSGVPSVAGYFINPVPGAIKSRGIKKGHDGVDLAAPTGTPIHAVADGVIMIARNGWNGGYGNYVVEQDNKGVRIIYGHMSKVATTPGAQVKQGDIIGYVGSTGHSTGPHLHLETVPLRANPF